MSITKWFFSGILNPGIELNNADPNFLGDKTRLKNLNPQETNFIELTRKNSEPKLGGSRYKKSKCPYCGNHTNSMMYFDFRKMIPNIRFSQIKPYFDLLLNKSNKLNTPKINTKYTKRNKYSIQPT